VKSKNYLIVEDSELLGALRRGQPVRAYQNIEVHPFLGNPRVFMEVTDSVKFKRDSVGNGKFVSNRIAIVHTKHPKSRKNSRLRNGS